MKGIERNTLTIFLIQFLLCCIAQHTHSQVIEIEWEMSYGGNGDDRSNAIIQTIDSGFVVAGYTNSLDGDITFNHGDHDFWITKLDSQGVMQWQTTYGGSEDDWCYGICHGVNGGYLLVGQTQSVDGDVTENKGGYDIWIVKIDDDGDIEWQKTLGGSSWENAYSVIKTTDDNYMIAGHTQSEDGDIISNHGSGDVWAIKINDTGTIIWQKTYGSSEWEKAYDIAETSSGEFYVAGYSTGSNGDVSTNNGASDLWLLKLDSVGSLIWENSFGGSEDDNAQGITLMNNGVICVGETYSDNYDVVGFHGWLDAWVIAVDSLGNLEWQKPYGGTNGDEAEDIIRMSENEFIFSGRSSVANGDITENKGGVDYWAVSIDSLGDIIWQKSIGGSNDDHAYTIVGTIDSQVVVAGITNSSDYDVTSIYGGYNYWVAKLIKCENTYYLDEDGDGFGNLLLDSIACEIPAGYSDNSIDCDDSNNLINPSASDICNSIDDNCNGEIDENASFSWWYLDADGDNYGDTEVDSFSCFGVEGYALDSADCDDTNPEIYPGAPEILNGIDDDCDLLIDEDLAINETILQSIKIYPNPTQDILYIDYTGNGEISIEVTNITGQKLFEDEITSSSMEINVSAFASGMYVLRIFAEEGEAAMMFVKE